jgi:ribonucleoside-diphosphate reductase alpha chain
MAGYNCRYIAVDSPRAFDETMFVLMSGTGVGFSVEKENINKLQIVNDYFESSGRVITVEDSKEGWAKALRKHIADLYLGRVHEFDYSEVRPAGARLKTMGGRASGPDPLKELIQFVEAVFRGAAGRKLSSLECHSVMCKIGEIVVVGGVRRSAMISLSDLGDHEMRDAKSGAWWENKSHFALANNSGVYDNKR